MKTLSPITVRNSTCLKILVLGLLCSGQLFAAATVPEKSQLLLKAYQLRKSAWNNTVQKNYEAACADLHQAINLTAQCHGENSRLLLPLYLDLSSAAQLAHHPAAAAAALNTCLKLDSSCADAAIKLSLLRLQQKNIDEATAAAKQAVKSAPQDPRAHMLMSLLLDQIGQTDQAAQEKNQAHKLYRSLPQTKCASSMSQEQITPAIQEEAHDESSEELELP